MFGYLMVVLPPSAGEQAKREVINECSAQVCTDERLRGSILEVGRGDYLNVLHDNDDAAAAVFEAVKAILDTYY